MTLDTPPKAPYTVSKAELTALGLDPSKIETRALVMVAQAVNLRPGLGEIALINTRGQGLKPYITRDGMLTIAHRSGQLDGIEVLEERRSSKDDGWTCYVQVWRKDMSHPFKYGAQCKDSEPQAKTGNGPEMALARAERRALKRAFVIPTTEGDDIDREEYADVGVAGRGSPSPAPRSAPPAAPEWPADPVIEHNATTGKTVAYPDRKAQAAAHATIGKLSADQQRGFMEAWGIEDFGSVWPADAVTDALEAPFGTEDPETLPTTP